MKKLVLISLLICFSGLTLPRLALAKNSADHAKVRQELSQILSAREYDHRENAIDRFFTRIGRAIMDAITSVFRWLGLHISFHGSSFGEVLSTVGTWLAIGAFLVLLAFVVRKLMGVAVGKNMADTASEEASYDLPAAKPLLKQAAKLAESGDFRGAFRAAYLACIAYLDDIRALRFERSRTNWEYMRELRSGGHDRPYSELHPLTRDFDRKIYGGEICTQEDYAGAMAAYGRISGEEAK